MNLLFDYEDENEDEDDFGRSEIQMQQLQYKATPLSNAVDLRT